MAMNFKRLHTISRQTLPELKQWCKDQRSLVRSSSSHVVGDRWEKWFGKQPQLREGVKILEAEQCDRIMKLGQRSLPGCDSCLLLYYSPGSFIHPHRQSLGLIEDWVVQANIGVDLYFELEGQRRLVKDGEVFGYDSTLVRSTTICPHERWAIFWMKIKPQYLTQQLTLDVGDEQTVSAIAD